MSGKGRTIQKALDFLRVLPRVSLGNITGGFYKKNNSRARGQHGGKTHGCGSKGSKARQNYMRVGYETGSTPFYMRIPKEPYYEKHHLKREYPPISLGQLQLMIDTGRINPDEPIDLTSFCNTKLYKCLPRQRQFGVHLTLDGADIFKAKVNIEVQRLHEPVVAAIERVGGVITTAYYDVPSLEAVSDPLNFFRRGKPIPKRMMPPQELVDYYTDPKFRGYLADPEKIAEERFKLSQLYGYILPDLNADPQKEMLLKRKDPMQIFYDLQPGWLINLKDKLVLKPKDEELKEHYKSYY